MQAKMQAASKETAAASCKRQQRSTLLKRTAQQHTAQVDVGAQYQACLSKAGQAVQQGVVRSSSVFGIARRQQRHVGWLEGASGNGLPTRKQCLHTTVMCQTSVKGGAVCRHVGGKLWVKRSAGAEGVIGLPALLNWLLASPPVKTCMPTRRFRTAKGKLAPGTKNIFIGTKLAARWRLMDRHDGPEQLLQLHHAPAGKRTAGVGKKWMASMASFVDDVAASVTSLSFGSRHSLEFLYLAQQVQVPAGWQASPAAAQKGSALGGPQLPPPPKNAMLECMALLPYARP